MNKVIDYFLSIDTFEQQYVVLKGVLQPLQHTIMVPTHTILHPRLDVITIRYVQYISKNICNRIQAKKSIQRHHIIMTDADSGYVMYEIERCENLSLKGI